MTDEEAIRKAVVAQAKKVVEICSDTFAPCKLTLENTFSKFWVLPAKKTYSGKKANSIKDGKEVEGAIVIKGFGAVKRDRCDEAKRICNIVIESILNKNTMAHQDRVIWFKEQLKNIPRNVIEDAAQLAPFVLTAELGSEYKQSNSMVPFLAGLIQEDTGCKPTVGDRLSYVVAYFEDTTILHFKRVVPPGMFLKLKMKLDVGYYLEKQIYSCLKQVLCLPCHQKLQTSMKQYIDEEIRIWRMSMIASNKKKPFNFQTKRKPKAGPDMSPQKKLCVKP